jgi:hypothetical protein
MRNVVPKAYFPGGACGLCPSLPSESLK